ncbi:hypothetical protein [uncultured Agrobacterium sp.]|uniref:hypothetical protein n=1 Tax=uncultured Agrobacterium sp. TaxID=157277 RepID=UPI0025D3B857|nr:hypothetical protein [uncultured Agrobacterium sp.]
MSQSLSTRIAVRIELIARWLKEGIPNDLGKIPTTLNGWREYHNPDLGVTRIGSKTSFTTTHAKLGSQVLRLQGLIENLKEAIDAEADKKRSDAKRRRVYKPESARRRLSEAERDAALKDLATVTGHWHQARHELERKSKEADELKTSVLQLNAKVDERDDRVRYLLERLRTAGIREV